MDASSQKIFAPNKLRARLYREHKYVFFFFTDMIQTMGCLDFSQKEAVDQAKDHLHHLKSLLKGHAHYEESRIHDILKKKGSSIFHQVEVQHQDHDLYFEKAEKLLSTIDHMDNPEDKIEMGYVYYLDLREFFAQNLLHFDYEEKVILPELQRLVGDEEIREIDAISYRQMTPDHMTQMMTVLFPHMNRDDRFAFLRDIKDSQPEKFDQAWEGIVPTLHEQEVGELRESLGVG